MSDYELHQGDCLEVMAALPDKSIDAIITDPPYGTTACKWDTLIPFEPMWAQLKRLIKPKGAIVLFGSEPFSSALRMSNIKQFKYDWIWKKTIATNPMTVKIQPARMHEVVSVFFSGASSYRPIMEQGSPYTDRARPGGLEHCAASGRQKLAIENRGTRYPCSVQEFSNGNNGNVHPTQKPVKLLSYLVRTYTQEGETVLDFTMGSGTTGVACMETGRKFIGIELDPGYFEIAQKRIYESTRQQRLF